MTPDAASILRATEADLLEISKEAARADWIYLTYVTDDTERLTADATRRAIESTMAAARRTAGLSRDGLSEADRRKIELLRLSLPLAVPADPAAAAETTALVARMTGVYGK